MVHTCHNISSDIIESSFGVLKDHLPTCHISGFTESVLRLPLLSMFTDMDTDSAPIVRGMLQRSPIICVNEWKKQNLKPNPLIARRKKLA